MCVTILGDKPTLHQLNCLRHTDKNGKECKIHIIDAVAAHWRRLGTALNVSDFELDNIEHDRRNEEDYCQELLRRWLRGSVGGGEPVIWDRLVDAMEDARFDEVAQQVREVLSDEGKSLQLVCMCKSHLVMTPGDGVLL